MEALAAALLSLELLGAAHPGRGPTEWWRGLEGPAQRAPARGVVLLRTPGPSRVRVLGDTFLMGSLASEMSYALSLCSAEVLGTRCIARGPEFRAEGHAHNVTVSTFEMDRTEVTVEAYSRCVEAGPCSPSTTTPGDARFDRPDLPVTNVRWDDAVTYCKWVGGRLPTEAEWELAARGREGRRFPWGNVYNPRLCNHGSFANDPTDATDGYAWLAPVGSLPDGATPSGIQDMAGNAAEWVSDFYVLDADGHGYPARAETDPKGPATGSYHVVRGGSFLTGAAWVRAASRVQMLDPRSPSVGFRCAYSV
jgi:formylglycine-generating enzyme required for sulfatase activity